MRTLLSVFLALVACGAAAIPAHAQATDPASVIATFITRENAHDVEGVVDMFTADATVELATETLHGSAEIRAWQQELAAGHFSITTGPAQISGNQATWPVEIQLDAFRQLGLASLAGVEKGTFVNGKMQFFSFGFTPEALGQLQAASVIAAFVAGENAHDVEAVVNLFTSDATVELATGTLHGSAEIRAWQQELAAGHFSITAGPPLISGSQGTATWPVEIQLDAFRQLGLASLAGVEKATFANGKMQFFSFGFTPEALARFQAAQAAAAAPGMPRTGQAPAAPWGGLLAGLGLLAAGTVLRRRPSAPHGR